MRITRWDPADQDTVMACYAVHRAAHLVDEPHEPSMSAGIFRTFMTEGFDRNPGESWVARDSGDAVVAYYRVELPDLENKERAQISPVVAPAARRRGAGRELVGHAARRAAEHQRSIMEGEALEDSAGDAFARRIGATLSMEEVRRVQDLRTIPPGQIAGIRATAARAAAGYSLVTWTGDVPDRYLGQVAGVWNAFEDAPHGEGVEPQVWDADRIRERTGSTLRAGLARGYTVAAVQDSTGEMAALTQVFVDPESPEWGFQGLTAVTRPHRGHRLGLLVKTAMLDWLAEAEPRLVRIATGNGAANAHMIAVNETLGYEVLPPGYRCYELPVSSLAGQQ